MGKSKRKKQHKSKLKSPEAIKLVDEQKFQSIKPIAGNAEKKEAKQGRKRKRTKSVASQSQQEPSGSSKRHKSPNGEAKEAESKGKALKVLFVYSQAHVSKPNGLIFTTVYVGQISC